jgi:hypothetical protein
VTGGDASGGDAGGGGVTGDEAAWRDLVARYDMPADADPAAVPWPDRENLTERSLGQGHEGAQDAEDADGPVSPGPGAPPQPGLDTDPARPAGPAGLAGPARPGSGADRTRVIRPATPPPRGPTPVPDPSAEAEDDEHYIPPPPPPLPHLDPIAKGAWAALFGGPAYLVLTSFFGWTVPGWAALLAVMAFVGGFAVVVLRMGDGPSQGEGPDNGAVL